MAHTLLHGASNIATPGREEAREMRRKTNMTLGRWISATLLVFVLGVGAAHADDANYRGGRCNGYGCYPPGGGCNGYGCWSYGGGCNGYGCWSYGGGCNGYGCWSNGGGCNGYGCWNSPVGSCNGYGCS